jgi:ketosteroid isomerase-like protein
MSAIDQTQATREVVQTAYDGMCGGDIPKFLGQLADDCVLTEPPGHPAGGVYEGRDAIEAAFPALAGALGLRGVVVHHLLVDGDRAVGLLDMLCTGKDGTEYTMPLAESWLVRDGKAVEIKPYAFDLVELANRAAG